MQSIEGNSPENVLFSAILRMVQNAHAQGASLTQCILLSLIVSEVESAKRVNKHIRVAVSAQSIIDSESLKDLLQSASKCLRFTISTENIGCFSGADKSELETFLALSHKVVVFSHGVRTSELLSVELGEYDFIEAHFSRGGNTGLGGFGLHFGSNNAIKPEHKRERVVQAEKKKKKKKGEFIMLDNNRGELFSGKII